MPKCLIVSIVLTFALNTYQNRSWKTAAWEHSPVVAAAAKLLRIGQSLRNAGSGQKSAALSDGQDDATVGEEEEILASI